jgi:hypothetical protein
LRDDVIDLGILDVHHRNGHVLHGWKPDHSVSEDIKLFEDPWCIAVATTQAGSRLLSMGSDLCNPPAEMSVVGGGAELVR